MTINSTAIILLRMARGGGEAGRGPGQVLCAIEKARLHQAEIQNAAYEYQQALESGAPIVVGVNRFEQKKEQRIPTSRVNTLLAQA